MKNNILLIALIFTSLSLLGQEKKAAHLFDADSTWGVEIFHFPLGFAQEIPFNGIEEARFPKGWSNKDTSTFWSYAFVWSINLNEELTTKILEDNLKLYFDGLTGSKNTIALFLKKEEKNSIPSSIGKVNIFDRFVTQKTLTLNVLVEQQYCKQQKKSVILFRFSPKDFEHEVWNTLNELKLTKNVCDL